MKGRRRAGSVRVRDHRQHWADHPLLPTRTQHRRRIPVDGADQHRPPVPTSCTACWTCSIRTDQPPWTSGSATTATRPHRRSPARPRRPRTTVTERSGDACGEVGDRLVESVVVVEVFGDGDRVTGAGVRAGEGPPAVTGRATPTTRDPQRPGCAQRGRVHRRESSAARYMRRPGPGRRPPPRMSPGHQNSVERRRDQSQEPAATLLPTAAGRPAMSMGFAR